MPGLLLSQKPSLVVHHSAASVAHFVAAIDSRKTHSKRAASVTHTAPVI